MAVLLRCFLMLIYSCVFEIGPQTCQASSCPLNWLIHDTKCYRAFPTLGDRNVTWTKSKELCARNGGTLVVIHSATVNGLVFDLCKTFITWRGVSIGLTDITNEGLFVWEDGTSATFTTWGGEPNNWMGDERCGEMLRDGTWNDFTCSEKSDAVVCEKSISISGLAYPTCPPLWTPDRSHRRCYRLWEQSATWTEARDLCRQESASLPIIHSPRKNERINNLIKSFIRVPIGLRDALGNRVFTWEDNSNLTFSNWRGQPDNLNGEQDCVQMNPRGNWDDVNCHEPQHGYVCEKPAVISPRGTATRPDVLTTTDSTASKPSNSDVTTIYPDAESPEDSNVALYAGIGGGVFAVILIVLAILFIWCIKRGHMSKSSTNTGNKLCNKPLRHPNQGSKTATDSARNDENSAYTHLGNTSEDEENSAYAQLRQGVLPKIPAQTPGVTPGVLYEEDSTKAQYIGPGNGSSDLKKNNVKHLSEQFPETDYHYIYMEPLPAQISGARNNNTKRPIPSYVEIIG